MPPTDVATVGLVNAVVGIALVFAAAYVLLNLTADVLATLSNPRLVHRR